MRIPEPPSYTTFYLATLTLLLAAHFTLLITLTNTRLLLTALTLYALYYTWRAAYQLHLLHQVRDSTLHAALLAISTLEVETKTARLDTKICEVNLRITEINFELFELGAKMVVVEVQTANLWGATTDLLDRIEELEERGQELEEESERLRVMMVELRVAAAEMRAMASELRATVEAGGRRRELCALWWGV